MKGKMSMFLDIAERKRKLQFTLTHTSDNQLDAALSNMFVQAETGYLFYLNDTSIWLPTFLGHIYLDVAVNKICLGNVSYYK